MAGTSIASQQDTADGGAESAARLGRVQLHGQRQQIRMLQDATLAVAGMAGWQGSRGMMSAPPTHVPHAQGQWQHPVPGAGMRGSWGSVVEVTEW